MSDGDETNNLARRVRIVVDPRRRDRLRRRRGDRPPHRTAASCRPPAWPRTAPRSSSPDRGARARCAGRRSAGYEEDELIREPNLPDPKRATSRSKRPWWACRSTERWSPRSAPSSERCSAIFTLIAYRNTVANFIGLARGLRPWWDARAGEWVRRPYYTGLIFHRVIPGYMVQSGDYLADGTGTVGYTIDDEGDDTGTHDRAGQLAMANADGEDTAGAQFFITDGPAPELDDDGYTVFGQCLESPGGQSARARAARSRSGEPTAERHPHHPHDHPARRGRRRRRGAHPAPPAQRSDRPAPRRLALSTPPQRPAPLRRAEPHAPPRRSAPRPATGPARTRGSQPLTVPPERGAHRARGGARRSARRRRWRVARRWRRCPRRRRCGLPRGSGPAGDPQCR